MKERDSLAPMVQLATGLIGPGRIAEAQEEASQQAAALQPVSQALEPLRESIVVKKGQS